LLDFVFNQAAVGGEGFDQGVIGQNLADTTAGDRTDNLGNKVFADVLPNFRQSLGVKLD